MGLGVCYLFVGEGGWVLVEGALVKVCILSSLVGIPSLQASVFSSFICAFGNAARVLFFTPTT